MGSTRVAYLVLGIAIASCIELGVSRRSFQAQTPDLNPLIANALPAVVMILAVDVDNGKLIPRSSGSGTVIDSRGTILTNFHVVHDSAHRRLHDLFVVGVQRGIGKSTTLYCLGDPALGTLNPDSDLALLRCDRDRSGQPLRKQVWPSLPLATSDRGAPASGTKIWVLGYPGGNEGKVRISSGTISDTTTQYSPGQQTYLKTDIAITHGSSGGAVIDSSGALVGVASAFRKRTVAATSVRIPAARIGLIRPIEQAYELIANEHPKESGQVPDASSDSDRSAQ